MALMVLLGRAWRGAARPGARGAASLAEGGGGCSGRGVPVCPPCVPAPQPPCRAGDPPALRGSRVVCCPPPQGARPPCPRPTPACSLSCRDAVRKDCVSSSQACLPHARPSRHEQTRCGCNQDPVALRLQQARCARQADYEREVASRNVAPPAPPPCPAPYALGGERECARATDGCTYAVLHQPPPAPACPPAPAAACPPAPAPACPPAPGRCGPGRTPPPPRCVELAPDDACRIKGDGHLDPCAHRPRVMVEIDRSATASASTPACAQKSSDPCTKTVSQAAPAMSHSCTSGSGHPKWCASPPQPAPVPPRCRRLTIVERLRARPPGTQSERRTHTSVALSKAGKCERSERSDSSGLDGMLRSRAQLKEAGLGRVVIDAATGQAPQSVPPGGRLELCVPAGTERVAVHVSLMRKSVSTCPAPASTSASCPPASSSPASCPHAPCAPAACAPAACAPASSATACVPTSSRPCATSTFDANSGRRDPWLSIKKIQKKLTGRCDQGLVDLKANALSVDAGRDCPKPTASCGSSKPAPTSPPTSKPSAPCGTSPNGSKTDTKRCSSTSAFFANTIIVNS